MSSFPRDPQPNARRIENNDIKVTKHERIEGEPSSKFTRLIRQQRRLAKRPFDTLAIIYILRTIFNPPKNNLPFQIKSSIINPYRKFTEEKRDKKKRDLVWPPFSFLLPLQKGSYLMLYEYYTLGSLACQDCIQAIKVCFGNNIIDETKEKGTIYEEKLCISHKDSSKKWSNWFLSPNELDQFIKTHLLTKKSPYYIANQPLNGRAFSRKSKDQFSYKTIVIDVDAHKYLAENKPTPAAFQAQIDELIYRITRDTKEIGFNMAVETGRGVQFWLFMEETSKALRFLHTRAVNTLCKVISDILTDYGLDQVFEVDMVASKKDMGLFRLPGSFDPRTNKATVTHVFSYDKHDYNDLNQTITDLWDLTWNETKGKKRKKARITPISRAEANYLALMSKRVCLIDTMVDRNMIDIGQREVAMFLYFNAARQLSWTGETAEDKTEKLNSRLKSPLNQSELNAIFRNPKVYKISNKLWYEYLGIDQKEVEGLVMTKSNAARDLRRLQKKETRNEAIEGLYSKQTPIKEIARKLGISVSTVRKVLDAKDLRTTKPLV